MAACIALAAFVVSIVAGLGVNNPTEVILSRALMSMAGGFVVGMFVGLFSERIVREVIASSLKATPSSSGVRGGGDRSSRENVQ
ncbi:MAG: hypothetical protein IBJ18_12135 [Phycisphaerales bacterium]|nr:hypothetical protein [Phycisphaerales bacterium]